jgi:hypothetical protein
MRSWNIPLDNQASGKESKEEQLRNRQSGLQRRWGTCAQLHSVDSTIGTPPERHTTSD